MLGRILPSMLGNGSMSSFVKTFVSHTNLKSRILSAINPSPLILQTRMAGTYKLKSNSVTKTQSKLCVLTTRATNFDSENQNPLNQTILRGYEITNATLMIGIHNAWT